MIRDGYHYLFVSACVAILNIDPPMNFHLENANRANLIFSWNSVYPSCPSLHYHVRTTNCGTCSMNVDSTTVLCDSFNVSADLQVCSIAIQRRCGDNIIGNMSDILQVIWKGEELSTILYNSYYWSLLQQFQKLRSLRISHLIIGIILKTNYC